MSMMNYFDCHEVLLSTRPLVAVRPEREQLQWHQTVASSDDQTQVWLVVHQQRVVERRHLVHSPPMQCSQPDSRVLTLLKHLNILSLNDASCNISAGNSTQPSNTYCKDFRWNATTCTYWYVIIITIRGGSDVWINGNYDQRKPRQVWVYHTQLQSADVQEPAPSNL